ncbi:hypothetical protein ACBY01_06060 [Sphingomonas sp. ac-8]|uniref:hypothetical protein n=1 Tax=Sphingomonas sp. ac-8 TaxID=3242977 RepID=UPI003A7F8BFA
MASSWKALFELRLAMVPSVKLLIECNGTTLVRTLPAPRAKRPPSRRTKDRQLPS